MARAPCTFRQSDVTRTIKAVTAAGFSVVGVTVDPQTGRIEVVIDKATAHDSASAAGGNEWDRA